MTEMLALHLYDVYYHRYCNHWIHNISENLVLCLTLLHDNTFIAALVVSILEDPLFRRTPEGKLCTFQTHKTH